LEKEDHVMTAQIDDRHEAVGARVLEHLFPEAVYRPVSLHVAAKRYLCFTEPQYWTYLSPASRQSLELQGGPFDKSQATSFEHAPYWREATQLRRFDDMGKQQKSSNEIFGDYMPLMRSLLVGAARN
jgi:[1-hydroxy-2-(trimethylamino)ethyl]phosphonate dioxygenase